VAFIVVLDTNVLLPAPVRDTLLRLAEAELYVPKWSQRILEELGENLVESGRTTSEKAERVVRTIRETFEDAEVPAATVSALEPAMTNDAKDRHVLAAAVGGGAQLIVTRNIGDFPAQACNSFGIDALTADDFLVDLYHLDPPLAANVIEEQADALTNPPMTSDDVLGHLELDAPDFVQLIQANRYQRAGTPGIVEGP
jgi:predicted nucleic acid-binding protein